MSAGLFVEELDECLFATGSLVRDGLLGTLGEVLDGGVRLDALVLSRSLGVGGFGVDLGDEDGGLGGEVVSKSLPDRGKALAVCAFG